MNLKRRCTIALAGCLALALATWVGFLVYVESSRVRYAENVILREAARPESVWRISGPDDNALIRVGGGPFKGWYLAADDRIDPVPTSADQMIYLSFEVKPGPYVRNLYLRKKRGLDCYWRITRTPSDERRIQSKNDGRYENWYLDLLQTCRPDANRAPRTAWNLVLNQNQAPGTQWVITPDGEGMRIQATCEPFAGWFLDCLFGAHVLERRLGDGAEPRQRQSPPLAKRN